MFPLPGDTNSTTKESNQLLDSLSELKKNPHGLSKQVVAFFLVMAGGHATDQFKSERYSTISTHALWDPENDPILRSCFNMNLTNNPEDQVNVIFVPAFLNGKDGVLDMEYYEALAGCDLTIYPSIYEPWGYTPLESIAYSIPTVTSDVAGFGKWILNKNLESEGIHVLRRLDKPSEETTIDLANHIRQFSSLDSNTRAKLRQSVRMTALNAEWELFYKNYLKAYEIALKNCQEGLKGRKNKKSLKFEGTVYRGADSLRPRFKQFSVKTSLPKAIERLRDLSYNLWWVWNADAQELFIRLDPVLFDKISNNPVNLLELVDPHKLEAMAKNESYMLLYENVMKKFDKYMGLETSLLKDLDGISRERPIAYFSMEFGIHECLPLYSGGLGILSGDHIKSSSDLNLPLIGVGLLYKNGYFKQSISKEGEQKVEYFYNDFFSMPLVEVTKNSERFTISLDYPRTHTLCACMGSSCWTNINLFPGH